MRTADDPPFILVVDDDDGILEVVEAFLIDEGYDVAGVHDADEAMSLLVERPVSLILLDLTTPGMDPGAFVSMYRQRADGTAPLVVVSGRHDVAQTAARIGATAALSKPFDLIDLLDTVEEALASDTSAAR